MKKNFSIREAFSFGFAIFKKRPWFFIALTIAPVFVSFGSAFCFEFFVFVFMRNANELMISLINGILQFFGFFLSLYVQLGVTRLYLLSVDGKTPKLTEIFAVRRNMFFQYLLVFITTGAMIVIGLILFIIPGIILSLMLQYAVLCLIDDNKGFVHAIRASRDITSGVKWKLLKFSLVSGFVIFIGLLFLGVGLLVATPVFTLAHTYIYRTLKKQMVS
jgi:uncharacterized membrane protein